MSTTPLDLSAPGRTSGPFTAAWTPENAILYALGVGAGQEDPGRELDLTTQNTGGMQQQVLPTFAIWLGQRGLVNRVPFGDFNRGALVHAEQSLEVYQTIPPSGSAELVGGVDGIYDKGSGALVQMSVHAVDPASAEPLWSSRLGYFIRGAGGFGGPRGPVPEWDDPAGGPDAVVPLPTRPDQALIFRLSGDFNPLHADPSFAKRAGFPRPILHGLCTYGLTARALVRLICDGDQSRLRSIDARFSKPVYPGEELRLEVWRRTTETVFRVFGADGRVVLDRGRIRTGAAHERDNTQQRNGENT